MGSSKQRAFWAVPLQGAPNDLDKWQQVLREPFDPVVQQISQVEGFVLRCAEFSTMPSQFEVAERARIIIHNLNGAMRATSGTGRVNFNGTVAEVMMDGTVRLSAFAEGKAFLATVSHTAEVKTGGTPSPPEPALAQKWVQLAATNDIVADMLRNFGNVPSWQDLYKTWDNIRALCNTADLLKRPWAPDEDSIKNFTHTANYYRHGFPHAARKKPPLEPMLLEVAHELVRRMVYGVMTDLVP